MRGFSLIEMLIVLSVIAVLAVIAVPRYKEIVARTENAGAMADLGQLVRSELAFLGDWQQFGRTNSVAAVGAHGAGVYLLGPGTLNSVIACPSQYVGLGISNGVNLVSFTSAANGASFTGMTKHLRGTRIFAFDSDVGVVRMRVGTSNVALDVSGVSINATSGDDLPDTNAWQNL